MVQYPLGLSRQRPSSPAQSERHFACWMEERWLLLCLFGKQQWHSPRGLRSLSTVARSPAPWTPSRGVNKIFFGERPQRVLPRAVLSSLHTRGNAFGIRTFSPGVSCIGTLKSSSHSAAHFSHFGISVTNVIPALSRCCI